MNLGQYLVVAVLLVHGVWLGVAVGDAVARVPVWERMAAVEYATDFRRHILRVDPMQPILAIATVLASIFLALRAGSTEALLIWVSVALMVLIILASVFFAEPVNSKFRRLPEGTPPEGVEGLRAFWCRFHRVRTITGALAYCCLVVAVGRIVQV